MLEYQKHRTRIIMLKNYYASYIELMYLLFNNFFSRNFIEVYIQKFYSVFFNEFFDSHISIYH